MVGIPEKDSGPCSAIEDAGPVGSTQALVHSSVENQLSGVPAPASDDHRPTELSGVSAASSLLECASGEGQISPFG
jgi:hypothetical protein